MRRGVRSVKLKGLWVHPRSGLPYHRSRRGGKTVLTRLPSDLTFDHPDFLAAFAAAAKDKEAPRVRKSGTVGSAWAALEVSDGFMAQSSGYRAILKREGAKINDQVGHVKVAAIQTKHINSNVTQATNKSARLKAWRFFFEYCASMGWISIESNPAIHARLPKAMKKAGHHPTWTPDDIELFRARHPLGTAIRAVFELAYWTGARVSDVVKVGPRNLGSDGVLEFTQTKTGDVAYVPWTCALPDYVAHLQPELDLCHEALKACPKGFTFLATKQGRQRSEKAAGTLIREKAHAIGIEKSIHGLRSARAVVLAQNGGGVRQIGAWTGHQSLKEIQRYTEQVNRRNAVQGTGVERKLETKPELSGNHGKRLNKNS